MRVLTPDHEDDADGADYTLKKHYGGSVWITIDRMELRIFVTRNTISVEGLDRRAVDCGHDQAISQMSIPHLRGPVRTRRGQ